MKKKKERCIVWISKFFSELSNTWNSCPSWLAEGIAQYMYDNADWDHWDTHRDMILRDRAINDNLLSFNEMNTFGKKGIGNESTYNSGFALSRYIAYKYGSGIIKDLMVELSNPFTSFQLMMRFITL